MIIPPTIFMFRGRKARGAPELARTWDLFLVVYAGIIVFCLLMYMTCMLFLARTGKERDDDDPKGVGNRGDDSQRRVLREEDARP